MNKLATMLLFFSFFAIILITASFMLLFFSERKWGLEKEYFSIEECEKMAYEYVKSLYPYSELQGENIRLTGKGIYDCSSCYSFEYSFEVNSLINPGRRETAKIKVYMEDGKIIETNYSESLIIAKTLCLEKQREAEACIEVYEPVCGSNNKTYTNGCFACLDEKVISYTEGECS